MSRCTVCERSGLRKVLDLGLQPPSNRFVAPGGNGDERYRLSLGDCADCGTVQLVDRMPVQAIRPRYEWLANNEPEGHLDDLVDKLGALPGVGLATRFLGVSYKDRSTLDRLTKRGFAQVINLDLAELGVAGGPFGLETIQRLLSDPAYVSRLRDARGPVGVVLARHFVEHAESAARFLARIRGLLDDGYLMLEFPDNSRILRGACHAFVWEEHFTYFTVESFRILAALADAEIVRMDRYSYRHEDALVAVLRFKRSTPQAVRVRDDSAQADLHQFASSFAAERARWQAELSRSVAAGHRLAVFGAGHLAVKLINFMELGPWLDCVVDDHPAKIGMRMPGSHLPIVSSATLEARGIDVCISTLSPESEARVRRNLGDFFRRGGCFVPAFDTPQEI